MVLFIGFAKISFFFNDTATTEIYTLSLHDALPISHGSDRGGADGEPGVRTAVRARGPAPGIVLDLAAVLQPVPHSGGAGVFGRHLLRLRTDQLRRPRPAPVPRGLRRLPGAGHRAAVRGAIGAGALQPAVVGARAARRD